MRSKVSQGGYLGSLVAVFVLALLLVGSLGFGVWAFISRNNYKSNSDAKFKAAVEKALADQKTSLTQAFDEQAKQPFVSFQAPSELGSMTFLYPRTWSVYADIKTGQAGGTPLDGYANPGYVPGLASDTAFALRFQVSEKAYDQELKSLDSYVKNGSLKLVPFTPEKVSSVVGARGDGQISSKRKGAIVLLPLRDKTIKIWTETDSSIGDFTTLLKSLSFTP